MSECHDYVGVESREHVEMRYLDASVSNSNGLPEHTSEQTH